MTQVRRVWLYLHLGSFQTFGPALESQNQHGHQNCAHAKSSVQTWEPQPIWTPGLGSFQILNPALESLNQYGYQYPSHSNPSIQHSRARTIVDTRTRLIPILQSRTRESEPIWTPRHPIRGRWNLETLLLDQWWPSRCVVVVLFQPASCPGKVSSVPLFASSVGCKNVNKIYHVTWFGY